MATTTAQMLPFASDRHHAAHEFLVIEADLLDQRRYDEWLELLAEDIVYRMPVRVTTSPSLEDSVLDGMDHFNEDSYSLRRRVARFATEHAWTEDPPSRTRHFVSNVRCYPGEHEDETVAKSHLLLFRSRLDVREPDFVVGERTDVLRLVDERLRLARRDFLVDESVLRTQNLAVFV
jgi:3-phenylpropionate/cinnamic acid dioxygenase small subunit